MISLLACCRRLSLLFALAAVTAALVTPARADTKLQWKFKSGEKTNYVLTTEMNQSMTLAGAPFEVKATQTMDMSWEVTGVADDGSATMKQTIDRLQMEMSLPLPGQAPIKFDSADDKALEGPGGEQLGKLLRSMVGHPFELTVSPTGKVSEFKAPAEMLEALKASPLGASGGPFSEDGLKQMLGQSMLQLPADPIAKGKQWDTTLEMKMPPLGKMLTKTIYTYAGEEERDGQKVDKIDVNVEVTTDETDENAQVKVKDSSGKGAIYWDNEAGQPIETAIDTKVNNELSINGTTTDQTIVTKVLMKRVSPPKS